VVFQILFEGEGKQAGEIRLDLLLPGVEDALKGAKVKVSDFLNSIGKVGGKVGKEAAIENPFSGIIRSGWGHLEKAGEPGVKLKRLLARARADFEAEAVKAGYQGKLGGQIWEAHGDEIKNLVSQIPDKAERDKINEIIQTQLGRLPAAKSQFKGGIDELKKFQAATKLSQFVISNTSALATNFMRGNTKAATKALYDTIFDFKNSVNTARKTGALRSVENEFENELARDIVSERINKYYGISKSEKVLRTMSALTGRSTAKELFETLKKNPGDTRAAKRLDDLLLEDIGQIVRTQGALTEKQLNRAAGRMAELTQGRAESIDLPPLWTGHPMVDLATQFKRYAFVQTRNMKEAFWADPERTITALLTVFPVIGELVGDTKAGIKGVVRGVGKEGFTGAVTGDWSREDVQRAINEELEGRGKGLERYFNNLAQSWALGLFYDLYSASSRGEQGLIEWFGGPTGSDVSETGSALYNLGTKGRTEPLKRKAARMIPVIGTGVASNIRGSYYGRQQRRAREKRSQGGRGDFAID
jgi:hypothetical protein